MMEFSIDTSKKLLLLKSEDHLEEIPLYSRRAFELLSDLWVKVSFSQKYVYTFTWLGRPIIQLPEDLVRVQEIVYALKPDVIVETGIAHGGSLIFYASLLKLIGKGKVVGVDIEIREHNRKAIEQHDLSSLITLIEGDSVSQPIVDQVKEHIKPNDTVLVILDSCHSYSHVKKELAFYHNLVTSGSYIVVCDGSMQDLYDNPQGHPSWKEDNPVMAVKEFLKENNEFYLEETPEWLFNESFLNKNITYWPSAWLKKN